MRHTVGVSYSCRNCKKQLEQDMFATGFNPIHFGKIIAKCPNCGTEYISHVKEEFFSVTNTQFYTKLIFSLIKWLFVLFVIFCWVTDSEWFLIIISTFVFIYIIQFKLRWDNGIEKSKERICDLEYLVKLIYNKIITLEDIEKFNKDKIIPDELYNKVKQIFKI